MGAFTTLALLEAIHGLCAVHLGVNCPNNFSYQDFVTDKFYQTGIFEMIGNKQMTTDNLTPGSGFTFFHSINFYAENYIICLHAYTRTTQNPKMMPKAGHTSSYFSSK